MHHVWNPLHVRKNVVTITWANAGEGIKVKGDVIECLHVFAGEEEKAYTFATEGKKLILNVEQAEEEPLKVKFAKNFMVSCKCI